MSGPAGSLSRGRTISLLIVAVLVLPGGAALFGVNVWQSLLLAALGLTICALIRFRPRVENDVWWPEAVTLESDEGARRDVARLSWSVSGNDQQVGRTLRIRLHNLAARRLARRGIDLDDPDQRAAAIEALGADTVRAISLDVREVVSLRTFQRAVQAVADLEPEATAAESSSGAR